MNSFLDVLTNAAGIHAGSVELRMEDDAVKVFAVVRGDPVLTAQAPVEEVEDLLQAAFALCDGDEAYAPGASRMMRMTGDKAPLPDDVAQIFMQFMPARSGGGRRLVARISYQGDMCCGSCGG